MDLLDKKKIKQLVKEKYASISTHSGCCSTNINSSFSDMGKNLKYSKEDISYALESKMLVLGCGNPIVEAELVPGEVIVDLGCGAGFDVFLSAKKVTKSGYVIGIDMTSEMIDRAKINAENLKMKNVDFRLGEIESLPVSNNTANVVISNCVINLSTDKSAVYREIFRILKPGGRISISDVLKSREIPEHIINDPAAYTG